MISELNIKFVTDELGNKKAVQIPYEDWLEIEKELTSYFEYQKLKEELTNAFKEVKEIKEGKVKAVSLKEFLDEC